MKNITLYNIATACRGRLFPENAYLIETEASSVEIDSRKVTENGIFIATRGEKVDGHSFIPQVYEKKALGVICEEAPKGVDIPYILVEDSLEALKELASFYRAQLDIPIVGITGSVGKTSTKEFIAATLEEKFRVCKTQGNFNNEVGMPLTLLSIREEHEIAVVEMGISDFGEMSRLSRISRPDSMVITNIGQCHLENLHDRDGVLRAKTESLYYLKHDGLLLLNGDDDKLFCVEKPWNRDIEFFGENPSFDIFVEAYEGKGLWGSKASVNYKGQSYELEIPLPGRHMVNNAMAAFLIAMEYGMTPSLAVEGIKKIKAVGGRSHVIRIFDKTVIDDCYNANPVSVKAAIDLLNMADGRKVAILGDMFELGENEKRLHFEIGEYAMLNGADVLICIGELSKNTFEGAKSVENSDNVYYFPSLTEAVKLLPGILDSEDSILIKASHGMHFENIVNDEEIFK